MIQNTIDFQQKINVDVTTKFDENEILKTFFLLNSIQNWIQNSEISWIQFYKIFIKFEKWLSIMAILISMLGQDNELLSEGRVGRCYDGWRESKLDEARAASAAYPNPPTTWVKNNTRNLA